MAIYNFNIKTGDQQGAGTDSNIFVKLFGSRGLSQEVRLNGYIRENAFERNQLDTFSIDYGTQNFGDIYKIEVRSDCMYAASDWLCAYFEIQSDKSPNKSFFNIDKWIDNENTNPYLVTSGYVADVPLAKIDFVEIIGSKHYVPSNVEAQMKCTNSITVAVDYRKIETIDNTTHLKIEVEVAAVKSSVENVLKFGVEKQIGMSLQHVESTEVTCTIPSSTTPRIFQEIWSEENYFFETSIGQETYKFNVPKKRILAGLIELTK